MRVLLVHPGPSFSVADVWAGMHKGLLGQGCQLVNYNLDDRLEFYTRAYIRHDDGTFIKAVDAEAAFEAAALGIEHICYEWWPDVVIIVSGFFVPQRVWEAMRARTHHVVYWGTESPYEDDRQAVGARYADTVILNDPTNLDAFRADVNPRTFYLPHSYDPDIHSPGPASPDLACDFAFVGTGFPSRIDWLEQVDWTGLRVKLGGHWKPVTDDSPLLPFLMHKRGDSIDNTEAAALYRSAATSLNLYRKEHSDGSHADGWAMSPREVELAACRTFFFRESRPEGDDLFPMLPTVTTPEAFSDELRWWLAHDAQREAAAAAARQAIADRTFTNTVRRLLELIESANSTIAA